MAATPSSLVSIGSSASSSSAAAAVAAIVSVLPSLPTSIDSVDATVALVNDVIKKLNYTQRLEWAGRFGAKFKDSANIINVINKLREHPAPKIPQIKADEDKAAAELLPPQRKNIAKYFDVDHVAMAMAVAAGKSNVLVDEVKSPSLFFKSLAITQLAKQGTDDHLYNLIIGAAPAVRTKLIRACVRAARQNVLDRAIEPLIKLNDVQYVVPWLHGCGRAAVSAAIIAHPEIWEDAKLDWQKFILFHGPVFIDALRRALVVAEKEQTRYYEACDRKAFLSSISSAWQTWTNKLQGKQRKHMTNAFQLLLERSEGHGLSHEIIKLAADFPIYFTNGRPPYANYETWRYDYPVASTPSTLTWYGRQLPQFITNRYAFWLHKHPNEMAELFKAMISMRKYDYPHRLKVSYRITNHKGDYIRTDVKEEPFTEIFDSIQDQIPHHSVWSTRDLPISFVTSMFKHILNLVLTRRLYVRPPANRGHEPSISDRGDDYHQYLEQFMNHMQQAWNGLKSDNDRLTLAQLIETTFERLDLRNQWNYLLTRFFHSTWAPMFNRVRNRWNLRQSRVLKEAEEAEERKAVADEEAKRGKAPAPAASDKKDNKAAASKKSEKKIAEKPKESKTPAKSSSKKGDSGSKETKSPSLRPQSGGYATAADRAWYFIERHLYAIEYDYWTNAMDRSTVQNRIVTMRQTERSKQMEAKTKDELIKPQFSQWEAWLAYGIRDEIKPLLNDNADELNQIKLNQYNMYWSCGADVHGRLWALILPPLTALLKRVNAALTVSNGLFKDKPKGGWKDELKEAPLHSIHVSVLPNLFTTIINHYGTAAGQCKLKTPESIARGKEIEKRRDDLFVFFMSNFFGFRFDCYDPSVNQATLTQLKGFLSRMTPEQVRDNILTHYEGEDLLEAESATVLSLAPSLSMQERLRIFGMYTMAQVIQLTMNSDQWLRSWIDLQVGPSSGYRTFPLREREKILSSIHVVVSALLVEETLAETTKDWLKEYQDVSIPAVRAALHKETDSKVLAERQAGMTTLWRATVTSWSPLQMRRTLTHFRKKVRNDSVENRRWMLQLILTPSIHHFIFDSSDDVRKEVQAIILGMLDDALESGDLDSQGTVTDDRSHFILSSFISLSQVAFADEYTQSSFLRRLHNEREMKAKERVENKITQRAEGKKRPMSQAETKVAELNAKKAADKAAEAAKKEAASGKKEAAKTEAAPAKAEAKGPTSGAGASAGGADDKEVIPDYTLMEWATELQYRIVLFRKGEKTAAETFRISFTLNGCRPGYETKFVDAYLAAYRNRVVDRFPTWMQTVESQAEYLQPMFNHFGSIYYRIPVLQSHLEGLLREMKANSPKDHDGLLIINMSHPCVTRFLSILSAAGVTINAYSTGNADSFLRPKPARPKAIKDAKKKAALVAAAGGATAGKTKGRKGAKKARGAAKKTGRTPKPKIPVLKPDPPARRAVLKWAEDELSDNEDDDDETKSVKAAEAAEDLKRREYELELSIEARKKWYERPVLYDFLTTMLRSRQARRVLWTWVNVQHRMNLTDGSRRTEKQVLDSMVRELLTITPSAIYIRFVWRHLVRHRQELLTPFLNAQSTFHGAFYLPPNHRGPFSTITNRKNWWNALTPSEGIEAFVEKERELEAKIADERKRYEELAKKRPELIAKLVEDKKVAEKLAEEKRIADEKAAKEDAKRAATETKEVKGEDGKESKAPAAAKAPKKVKLNKKGQPMPVRPKKKKVKAGPKKLKTSTEIATAASRLSGYDCAEYFHLEASYGLHRLRPEQLALLAAQRQLQIVNVDRPIPERNESLRRWTLLPWIQYADIVEFLDLHEAIDPLKPKDKGMPINLIETGMRGCMYNDEVVAPLSYLLSPELLGSDRARVAIYSVPKSLPYIPGNKFSQLMRALLSGERRHAMKVTAYKQVIRMLASKPTNENIEMIVFEWKRKELHRDVRLAILRAALEFAKKPAFIELAWAILETAPQCPDQELLIALCAIVPEGQAAITPAVYKQYVELPRIEEKLTDFSTFRIPLAQASRFANKVVLPLARDCPDKDIRALAMYKLIAWLPWVNPTEYFSAIMPVYVKYMVDESPEALDNPQPSTQQMWNARFTIAMTNALECSGAVCNTNHTDRPKPLRELLKKTIEQMCASWLAFPADYPELRVTMYSRIQQTVNCLPGGIRTYPANLTYTVKDEEFFTEPIRRLLGPLAFTIIYPREISFLQVDSPQYNSNEYHAVGDVVPRASVLVHKGFSRLATCPYDRAFVITQVNRIFGRLATSNCNSLYAGPRRYARDAVGGLLRAIMSRQVGANANGNLGPQYLDACRSVSVTILQQNPWFIQQEDNVTYITDMMSDLAAAIAEDQMTRDNLQTLQGILVTALPVRDRASQEDILPADHPMCPIYPACVNIMRVLVRQFLVNMGQIVDIELVNVPAPTRSSLLSKAASIAKGVASAVTGKNKKGPPANNNNETKSSVTQFSSRTTERVANQIYGEVVMTLINSNSSMWLEGLEARSAALIAPVLVRHLATISPLARAAVAAGGVAQVNAAEQPLPLYPVDAWSSHAIGNIRQLTNYFLTVKNYATEVYNYNQRKLPDKARPQNPHYQLPIDLTKATQLLSGFLYDDEANGQFVFSNPTGAAATATDEVTKAHRTLRIEGALMLLLEQSHAVADTLAWKYRECKGAERRSAVEGLCRLVDEMLSYAMRSRANEASYLTGSFGANAEAATVDRINNAIKAMVDTFGSSSYLRRGDGNFSQMVATAIPNVTLTRKTIDALRYAIELSRAVRSFPVPEKAGKDKDRDELASRASQIIHDAILHVVEIPADLDMVTTEAIALINRLLPDVYGAIRTWLQSVRSIVITNLARRTLVSEATAAVTQCNDAAYISTCRSLTRGLLASHRWFLWDFPANLGTVLAFIDDHIAAVVRSELDFGVVQTQLNQMIVSYLGDTTYATGSSIDRVLRAPAVELLTQLVARWNVIAGQSANDAAPSTAAHNQVYGKIIFTLMTEQMALIARTLPVGILSTIVSSLLRHVASISPAVRSTGAAVPLPILTIDNWSTTLTTVRSFIESIFTSAYSHAQTVFSYNRTNIYNNQHYDRPIDLKQSTEIAFSLLYVDGVRPYFGIDASVNNNNANTKDGKPAASAKKGETKKEEKAAITAGDADALVETYLQGLRVNTAISFLVNQTTGIAGVFNQLVPEQKLGDVKRHDNTTKLIALIDSAIAYSLTMRSDTVDRTLPAGLPNWGRPTAVLPAVVTLVTQFTEGRQLNKDWTVIPEADIAYCKKHGGQVSLPVGTWARTDTPSTQVLRHLLTPLLADTVPRNLGDVSDQARLFVALRTVSTWSQATSFAVRQNRGQWQPAPKPTILPPKPRTAIVNGRSTVIQDETRVGKPLPVYPYEPDRIRDDEKVSPLTPFFHNIVNYYALLQPNATGTSVAVAPTSEGLPSAPHLASVISSFFVFAASSVWRRDAPYAHEEDDEKPLPRDPLSWEYQPQDTVRFVQSLFAPIIGYTEASRGAVATKWAYVASKLIEDFPRHVSLAYSADRTPIAAIAHQLFAHMSTHLPDYMWTSQAGMVQNLLGVVTSTIKAQPLVNRQHGRREGTILVIDTSARQLIARVVAPLAQLAIAAAPPATPAAALAWRMTNTLALDVLQEHVAWVHDSIGTTEAVPRIILGVMLAYSVPEAITAGHGGNARGTIFNLWRLQEPKDATTKIKPANYGLRWLDIREKHSLIALYAANSSLSTTPWNQEFKVEVKANQAAAKKAAQDKADKEKADKEAAAKKAAAEAAAAKKSNAKKGKKDNEPSAAAIAAAERLEAKARGEEKEIIPDLPAVPVITTVAPSPLLTTMASRSLFEDIEFEVQQAMIKEVPAVLEHTPSRVSFIVRCALLAIRRPPKADSIKTALTNLLVGTVTYDDSVENGPGVVREIVAAGSSAETKQAAATIEGKDGGGSYMACINGWLAGVALDVLKEFANRSKVNDKTQPPRRQWLWVPVFTELLMQFQRHDDPAVRLASLNTITRTATRD